MRRILLGTAAAAAVLTAVPVSSALADASHCTHGTVYSTAGLSGQVIAVGAGGAGDGTIYIDDRDYVSSSVDSTGGGLWIYQEANDRGWLQRGGTSLAGADLGGQEQCTPWDDFPDQVIF